MLTCWAEGPDAYVNIVRRGPDYVDADTGLHFVTLERDNGSLYGISFDTDETNSFIVDNSSVGFTDDYDAAGRFASSVNGFVVFYYGSDGDATAHNCPEVLDWLMVYYGLLVNPVSFPLYNANGYEIYISSESLCRQTSQNRSYLAFNTGSGYYGVKPSAAGWAGKVLGCDMGKVDATDIPAVTANTLQGVHSDNNHDVLEGYNAWMFYLCAGAPRALFE